jgi:hypothetical protein
MSIKSFSSLNHSASLEVTGNLMELPPPKEVSSKDGEKVKLKQLNNTTTDTNRKVKCNNTTSQRSMADSADSLKKGVDHKICQVIKAVILLL